MKFLISLLAFFMLISYSAAIICPENYCQNIDCDMKPKNQEACDKLHKLTPETKYLLTEKASLCGCCNKCIRIVNEGQACTLITRFVQDSRCADGLKCSEAGKCVKA